MKRPPVSRRDLAESVVMAFVVALLLLSASDAPFFILLPCTAAVAIAGLVLAFFIRQEANP